MKDTKFICYPFMEMDTWATDFEVATDGLSSEIGFAASLNDKLLTKDLEKVIEIVLDLNPMIRKPDKNIILDCKNKLIKLYEKYKQEFDSFYLPVGNADSTSLSRLRFYCKRIIRLIFKHDKSQRELLDIFHLLTNLFHHMYLTVSERRVKFVSKSY